jgi:hypothetical protein
MNDSIDHLFFNAVERADAETPKKGYTNERLINPNKVVCSGALTPNQVIVDCRNLRNGCGACPDYCL